MALIRCPDCGRRVSDRAVACPDCARPIAGEAAPVALDVGEAPRARKAAVLRGRGDAMAPLVGATPTPVVCRECGERVTLMHEPGRAWLCDDCGEAAAIRDAKRRALVRWSIVAAIAIALTGGAAWVIHTWLAHRPHDPVAPHSFDG